MLGNAEGRAGWTRSRQMRQGHRARAPHYPLCPCSRAGASDQTRQRSAPITRRGRSRAGVTGAIPHPSPAGGYRGHPAQRQIKGARDRAPLTTTATTPPKGTAPSPGPGTGWRDGGGELMPSKFYRLIKNNNKFIKPSPVGLGSMSALNLPVHSDGVIPHTTPLPAHSPA